MPERTVPPKKDNTKGFPESVGTDSKGVPTYLSNQTVFAAEILTNEGS